MYVCIYLYTYLSIDLSIFYVYMCELPFILSLPFSTIKESYTVSLQVNDLF